MNKLVYKILLIIAGVLIINFWVTIKIDNVFDNENVEKYEFYIPSFFAYEVDDVVDNHYDSKSVGVDCEKQIFTNNYNVLKCFLPGQYSVFYFPFEFVNIYTSSDPNLILFWYFSCHSRAPTC